jgi:lipopolysaccharide heptosyltransferase II
VLVKLRRRYPRARIDWLVTPENAELIRCHPALSAAVLFDRRAFRRSFWLGLRKSVKLLRELRTAGYDLVVDLHGQLRTAIFTKVTGAKVRIGFNRPGSEAPRHGWAGAREGAWLAYTHRMSIRTRAVHALDRYLWLEEVLALDDAPPDSALYLPPAADAAAAALLASVSGRPLAVLAPGTLWETKHWRIEGFAEISRRLVARGWAVAVTGTAGDVHRAEQIVAAEPGALNLCGRTGLAELAAILRKAQLAVTNDSGAMHLAAASGVPVVAIFGPTDPVQVGPYGQLENVIRAGVECSPCYLRRLSQCPNGHACMELVTADQVWRRVEAVLGAIQSTNS